MKQLASHLLLDGWIYQLIDLLSCQVNRVAGLQYAVDEEGRPVNPSGRTGLKVRRLRDRVSQ